MPIRFFNQILPFPFYVLNVRALTFFPSRKSKLFNMDCNQNGYFCVRLSFAILWWPLDRWWSSCISKLYDALMCVLLIHVELLKMIYKLLWTARCQYIIFFECDMKNKRTLEMLCANDWKGIDKDYLFFWIFSIKIKTQIKWSLEFHLPISKWKEWNPIKELQLRRKRRSET